MLGGQKSGVMGSEGIKDGGCGGDGACGMKGTAVEDVALKDAPSNGVASYGVALKDVVGGGYHGAVQGVLPTGTTEENQDAADLAGTNIDTERTWRRSANAIVRLWMHMA